jgi:hypothetical protein
MPYSGAWTSRPVFLRSSMQEWVGGVFIDN